jgi:hypothetical protein
LFSKYYLASILGAKNGPCFAPKASVLRITSRNIGNKRSIKLEGSLSGPWVEELHKVWCPISKSTQPENVTIDLGGLGFVDNIGRTLLIEIARTGAVVQGASPFVRQILQETNQEKEN